MFTMLNNVLSKSHRIPGKVKLELLRVPIFKSISELNYQHRIEEHAECLPKISPSAANFLKLIYQEGAVVTTLDKLPLADPNSLLKATQVFLPELQQNISKNQNSLRISQDNIIKNPEIFLWGMQEELLDIVENYLGLPVFYHRVEMRRDLVNLNNPINVSQWHRDAADYRMIKLIIYLNKVTVGGGAFEYMPKNITLSSSQNLRYHCGFVSDHRMANSVPQDYWHMCTGEAGTVIVADTHNVFHRIQAPVTSDRFSITFTYTSRKPVRLYDKVSLSPRDLSAISSHLSERQKKCLVMH